MNKTLQTFLICCAVLICLVITARLTGVVQYYKVATPANEPFLTPDQKIFTSSLKKIKRNDIVVFTNPLSDTINSIQTSEILTQPYLYRLCALENDVIEMKDGVFYVNGRNVDRDLNLYHFYNIQNKDVAFFETIYDKQNDMNFIQLDNLSLINLTDEMVKKIPQSISFKKYLQPADTSTFSAFAWYNKNATLWTADNFGPFTIPAGECFVLGDNRNNALDSRYVGCIKISNIKGVKL